MGKVVSLIAKDLEKCIPYEGMERYKAGLRVVESSKDYEEGIAEVNYELQRDEVDSLQLRMIFHGYRGEFSLLEGEEFTTRAEESRDRSTHPMDVIEKLNTNGKRVTLLVNSCQIGYGVRGRHSFGIDGLSDEKKAERYQRLPNNAVVILNSGKANLKSGSIFTDYRRNIDLSDDLEFMLDAITHSPETIKLITKKDGGLAIFAHSAPRPESPSDLSDENIRIFLERSQEAFVRFYKENILNDARSDALLEKYRAQITPDAIKCYRERAAAIELEKALATADILSRAEGVEETLKRMKELFANYDEILPVNFEEESKNFQDRSSSVKFKIKPYYKHYLDLV